MNHPAQPVGVFFGFRGMPATITVTKADGTKVVDGQPVAQQQSEPKEPNNGNQNV